MLLPLIPTRTRLSSASEAPPGPCRFCGLVCPAWMMPTQHVNETVPACLLCALCRGLDRNHIAEEITPIWLPEITQRALIAIVRRLHLIRREHGQSPVVTGVPSPGSPLLSRAWGLHVALLRRGAVAASRLGTVDLGEIGEALDDAARAGADTPGLLGGLRLLPLGRFFNAQGVDIYPDALASLLKPMTGVAA